MTGPKVHYGYDRFTACCRGRDGWKTVDRALVSCNACKVTLKYERAAFG